MIIRRSLCLVACLLAAIATHAHEVRPGYLALTQTDTESYDVFWKVPARGELRLAMYVRLPEVCSNSRELISTIVGSSYIDRWSVDCDGGLVDRTITIDGLAGLLTDVLVRVERLDGTTQIARLKPAAPSMQVVASPGWQQVSAAYLGLGVEHILLGIDHLLFVFALLLLVDGWRRLVATITAFTVAHSITLAAATLGFVNVPQSPVEAVIALSIVFLALELLRIRSGKQTLTERSPWTIAFAFGLLHGLGFAGALNEIGLPENAIPLALLFFNLGVELGQLLFVAVVLVIGYLMRRLFSDIPEWLPRTAIYAIGSVASFWTIERIAGF